ncbi:MULTISPECIES: AMP-binding protein [unclassified Pseudofrankia]|uniref:AMP-binding protein n=1 Tax=unclassified Pseudofrankia TaxID=2994372 RepID=UPI0008DAEF8D|nr:MULTISPECIES: AMP-binding protein [unclassified Pseudofrankia]MDT3444913.1 AMP-binding protein [Pseudofrankia sp. BMG5.37]OHV64823.1 acyl-CoA synthetase [Pseudofrankia sp. BMG5.36]
MATVHLSGSAANVVWTPGESIRERSRLLGAMRRWGFTTMESLHARSVQDPEWFWRAVVEDLDITFGTPFDAVMDDREGKPFPRWFVGGTLNVAGLCSHRHAAGAHAGQTAVVYEGDAGQVRTLTYAELDAQVRRFAANLVQLGVGRGDRVVLFLPVVPEATIAFLACAMIGALSVPAFTGYGAEALAMRLRASGAVVLLTADGTTRRGKPVLLKATADEALESAASVRNVVVVRHLDNKVAMQDGRDLFWDELDSDPPAVETVDADANDPLTIIYTSGTTGAPKGIVHSHAGFLVKAAVDFAYGFDMHDDDVVAWIADMGWMLGPLLLMGGLQLGATVVMIEGVPTYPTPDRLWQIAGRHGVTILGVAPTAARAVKAVGAGDTAGLARVRAFASTGEAWDEPTWRWLFETVGEGRRPIVNYSGGTETGGGILVSYPFLPSEPASFNGPLPGMDVTVLDESGQPIVGKIGELAVRNCWPGMTHAFWHDRERYLETYWRRWPDVWQHGDLASVDVHGTWRIHGRSDDVIKVSGRRVGPAEIEAALLRDSRISEAAVVGIPDDQRGQRVVAFVVLRDGDADYDDLVALAVHNVGKSFAPKIHVVPSLPKTKNGKIMRRAIRARHLGEPTGDMTALDPSTPLEDVPAQQGAGAER